MPERFEDALKALRHVARGNGLVMKIAARLESAHKREVDMAGAASAVDVSDDGPSSHEGTGNYPPITSELRVLAAMSKYELNQEQFKRVCDSIDAVHANLERENASLKAELDRVLGERDDRDGWVELPKDADGEVIRVGDVMEWVRYGDDDPTIVRTVIGVGFEVFFAWSDEQGRYAQYEAHAYRHHKPDTWERIIRDAYDAGLLRKTLDLSAAVVRCKALAKALAGEDA